MRDNCWTCRRPSCVCLCDQITKLWPRIRFVILAHPREARSRISTGFLAHLSLGDSRYIEGYDFKNSTELEQIIDDSDVKSYLLFPSAGARPVSEVKQSIQSDELKRINVIVIEATWSQARVILGQSETLQKLPPIVLDSPRHSRFQIRTQPQAMCLSTIEAIAYMLTDLGECDDTTTEAFLKPFLTLVDRQIYYQQHGPYRR